MFKLVILLLILFFTSQVFGICDNVNLVTAPNSPFNQIPVLNQTNSGTCYAYSASQMLNYQTVKRGLGAVIHPLWLAIRFGQYSGADSIDGGNAYGAMLAFQGSKTFCTKDEVEIALQNFSKKYRYPREKLVEFINKKGLFDENDTTNGCDVAGLYQFFQDPLIKKMTSNQIYMKLLMPECKLRKIPKLPEVHNEYKENMSGGNLGLEQRIHAQLSQNRSPIAISYCNNIWRDPNYVLNKSAASCEKHSSVLVGERIASPGGCQYLIRNTFGDLWNNYYANKPCLCRNRKTGAFADNCTPQTHNSRDWSVQGCWFPQRTVSQNTWQIQTFP